MSLSVTLRATHHDADLQMILQIAADAERIEATSMPCVFNSSAGPRPSCRSCGEL
jgi:hypothetical protein